MRSAEKLSCGETWCIWYRDSRCADTEPNMGCPRAIRAQLAALRLAGDGLTLAIVNLMAIPSLRKNFEGGELYTNANAALAAWEAAGKP